MKPDLDYISQLLQVFLESENAYITLDDFIKSDVEVREKVKLSDNSYIEPSKEDIIKMCRPLALTQKDAELKAEKKMENMKLETKKRINRDEQKKKFTEQFLFNINLLLDNQLIGTRNGIADTLDDIGISFGANDDVALNLGATIRLTSNGHDFAQSLANKEVLQKLKSEFKDAPFKTIFDGGQTLLQHVFKKKLDTLLEE